MLLEAARVADSVCLVRGRERKWALGVPNEAVCDGIIVFNKRTLKKKSKKKKKWGGGSQGKVWGRGLGCTA